MSSRPGSPSSDVYKNVATDNAQVGVQISVIKGGTNYFVISDQSTPRERFEIGLNHLRADAPAPAGELIAEAYARGEQSVEVQFYWCLAVVSGKTVAEMSQGDLDTLEHFLLPLRPVTSDPFDRALDLLRQTIFGLTTEDIKAIGALSDSAETTPGRFFRQRIDLLPEELRQDITRHLRKVLERLDGEDAARFEQQEIELQRFSDRRQERIYKFFLPDPRPPVEANLSPDRWGFARSLRLLLLLAWMLVGALLIRQGVSATDTFRSQATTAGVILALVPLLRGVRRMLRLSAEHERQMWRFHHDRTVDLDPAHQGSPTDAVKHLSTYLYRTYGNLLEALAPDDPTEAQLWLRATAGIRVTLTMQTTERYRLKPEQPSGLLWLVDHQVRQLRQQWDHDHFAETLRQKPQLTFCIYRDLLIGALATLCLVWALIDQTASAGLWVPLGAAVITGGLFLRRQDIAWFHHNVLDRAARRAALAQEYQDELAAYRRWWEWLADRPLDSEIARWLDYDLRALRAEALGQFRISGNDLISDLILTEAAAGCGAARMVGGPPRYTEYQVTVFLLTEFGVRQVTRHLDFLDGTLGRQERQSFRYETIVSANVIEVALPAGTTPRTGSADGRRRRGDRKNRGPDFFNQAFRITLHNGRPIDVLINNFPDWEVEFSTEAAARLYELALETSGVRSAAHVLEAVAGDGVAWIARERNRYRIAQQHFRERRKWSLEQPKPLPGTRQLPSAGMLPADSAQADPARDDEEGEQAG